MIKVLEEKSVPREVIECSNCHSTLEYGNADLSIDYEAERNIANYGFSAYYSRPMCFTCPVCGCKVSASWIIKRENK